MVTMKLFVGYSQECSVSCKMLYSFVFRLYKFVAVEKITEPGSTIKITSCLPQRSSSNDCVSLTLFFQRPLCHEQCPNVSAGRNCRIQDVFVKCPMNVGKLCFCFLKNFYFIIFIFYFYLFYFIQDKKKCVSRCQSLCSIKGAADQGLRIFVCVLAWPIYCLLFAWVTPGLATSGLKQCSIPSRERLKDSGTACFIHEMGQNENTVTRGFRA